MPARYTSLPSQEESNSRELADAFGSDNEDEDETTPLRIQYGSQDVEASAGLQPADTLPCSYDFERDYDVPPPGSPPRPSSSALPNDFGNNNGLLPTSPVRTTFDRRPQSNLFRRVMGAVLPTHYSQLPTEDSGVPRHRIGGGSDNDGVFANVMAKPAPVSESRIIRDPNGNIHLVPEDNQKEPPPTYAAAQADAVPAYWETTVHAPALDGDGTMLIDDLPSGSVWVFFLNLTISFFFQFVGFLLTFILHTSHAAKYGSRAGLGLTLIQYGFYSRASSSNWDDNGTNGVQIISTDRSDPPIPANLLNETTSIDPDAQEVLSGVNSRDWLYFLLMTIGEYHHYMLCFALTVIFVGWFLLLSSTISFWRVKRWESSIRSSTDTGSVSRSTDTNAASGSQFLTREDIENDITMRRNLATVFGINFDEEEQNARNAVIASGGFSADTSSAVGGVGGLFGWGGSAGRMHVDDNGHAIVIPGQEALEEARLARDLRAAGLL